MINKKGMMDMPSNKPPTLRELLLHKKTTDSDIIDVSRHNYKDAENSKSLYSGKVEDIPDNILDLKILAWIRKDGIYIAE